MHTYVHAHTVGEWVIACVCVSDAHAAIGEKVRLEIYWFHNTLMSLSLFYNGESCPWRLCACMCASGLVFVIPICNFFCTIFARLPPIWLVYYIHMKVSTRPPVSVCVCEQCRCSKADRVCVCVIPRALSLPHTCGSCCKQGCQGLAICWLISRVICQKTKQSSLHQFHKWLFVLKNKSLLKDIW